MIECPRCSKLIPADPQGHLPPWCPICGTDLRGMPAKPAADVPAPIDDPAPIAPAAEAETPATNAALTDGPPEPAINPADVVPPTVDHSNLRTVMLGVAALCGVLCALLVYLGMREPELQPQERIVRDAFEVRAPSTGTWKVDEERKQKEGADLVLEGTGKGFYPGYFLVQVIRPGTQALTPAGLAEQVKREWQAQIDGCQFVGEPGVPPTVAGVPALRIVAVGNALPNVRDTPHREAYVFVIQGVGYRLTCMAYGRNFEALRPAFDELIASFTPRTP